jgi:hypothetical protein
MPPQQAYGLLDFVDDIYDFSTHSQSTIRDPINRPVI